MRPLIAAASKLLQLHRVAFAENHATILVCTLLFFVVAAGTLAQQGQEFVYAARIAHTVSLLFTIYISLVFAKEYKHVLIFLGLCMIFWLAGSLSSVPYLISLSLLYVFAGACVAHFFDRSLRAGLGALTIVCLLLMIAQVNAWFGGAFNTWGQYGELPDGAELRDQLVKTFMVGEEELSAHLSQARPMGVFWSNQPLSFFLLIAVSHFIFSNKISIFWIVLTAAASVLSMSKVAILGSCLVCLTTSLVFHRYFFAATCYILAVLFAMIIYSHFYPGIAHVHFNVESILTSFQSRFLDIVAIWNFTEVTWLIEQLRSIAVFWDDKVSGSDQTSRSAQDVVYHATQMTITREDAFAVSTSLMYSIRLYLPWAILTAVTYALVFALALWAEGSLLAWLKRLSATNFALALSILGFSFTADFSGLPLFWLAVGLTVSPILNAFYKVQVDNRVVAKGA